MGTSNDQFQSSFGTSPPNTLPMLTAVAGIDIPAADVAEHFLDQILAIQPTNLFPYLVSLEAICTAVSTTIGSWSLLQVTGGAAAQTLKQPFPVVPIGTRFVWEFPTPLKGSSTFINSGGTKIKNSVGTMGAWNWRCNGFWGI